MYDERKRAPHVVQAKDQFKQKAWSSKLVEGERFVRAGRVRVRLPAVPYKYCPQGWTQRMKHKLYHHTQSSSTFCPPHKANERVDEILGWL